MPLDPVETTQAIERSYRHYLATTFRLSDHDLHAQLMDALESPDRFVKGPILEATPAYEAGRSIADLAHEGVLSQRFHLLQSELLPPDRPLYRHQERAIRKLVSERRNLVVATGTGSGKTETFLVPIIEHLLRSEEREGTLTPGARALLLYPMNALANDQLKRLRRVLGNYPAITFGRYTGETEEREGEAQDAYRRMYPDEPLLPNERISREAMRNAPPHILLTNYAMLEYLLLRPKDNVFFDGAFAGHWRFLVVDEAHVFTGAKGIEMAMLLRRLKDRVVGGRTGALQCIATSATLSGGRDDLADVCAFAERLFGEEVAWCEGDEREQDVVQATRRPWRWPPASERYHTDSGLYRELLRLTEETTGRTCIASLTAAGRRWGIPGGILDAAEIAAEGDEARLLYEVLRRDDRLGALRVSLEKGAAPLSDVAAAICDDSSTPVRDLVALVHLAARAKPPGEDQALLPARYHLFVRSVEGAYLSLGSPRRVFLERRDEVEENGARYTVFETAVCRQCGALYIVGEERDEDGRMVLAQPSPRSAEIQRNVVYLLLAETPVVPDDEDEVAEGVAEGPSAQPEAYRLCRHCGAFDKESLLTAMCECDPSGYVRVLKVPSKEGAVHACPACGTRSPSGVVWRFLTGNDAAASVLATALYQHIPDASSAEASAGRQAEPDEWGSMAGTSREDPRARVARGGRQLLIFSDSRQDAAFFAPYLDRTYNAILRRRLIMQALEDNRAAALRNRWRLQDLVRPLQRLGCEAGMFLGLSPQQQEAEVWKWLLYELVAVDRRNSLEGLGCLGFSLVQPAGWAPPKPLRDWGLDENEVWTLYQLLLDGFRTKGAVQFPDTVDPESEFFAPRNREYYFRGDGTDARRHISSWVPSAKGGMNVRLDLLMRLRHLLGLDAARQMSCETLIAFWARGLALNDATKCWHEYFAAQSWPGEGVAYRIRPDYWELRTHHVDPAVQWYQCDRCQRVTLHNLRGLCPTYRCTGRLHPCAPEDAFKDNHYRNLYTQLVPRNLTVKEHTAQLTSAAAAELQTQFIQGTVNVLSCSTTFELGVDVGELEAVFMRNVPPTAANYLQRAGRAGRRTSSTAFAVTFAQRRPHDLTRYAEPLELVSGEVKPPHFELANEKIVRRHLYATALSAFWRKHPETFGENQNFFFPVAGPEGTDLLSSYLAAQPRGLLSSLERITPPQLATSLGIANWGWVDGLYDAEDGVLVRATSSIHADVDGLEKARQGLVEKGRPSDYTLRIITTIKRQSVISYLASQNVLPKYGFPVDVVSLQVLHHGEEARSLELDRDLRIALAEYAPDSQVVARGKLWTSRYLKRLPDRSWRRYVYAICDHCHRYHSVLLANTSAGRALRVCEACGMPLGGRQRGVFLLPEFGFMTERGEPGNPGEKRPERTYSTRVYYSGESQRGDQVTLDFGRTCLVAQPAVDGQLAVVNHAGYRGGWLVCEACGYAVLGGSKLPRPHPAPWGGECRGRFSSSRLALGHEFKTDVLLLRFEGYGCALEGFWLSLLYALLEGASAALGIDRDDINGCLFSHGGDASQPTLVLFDDVPGGAGHVRRVTGSADALRDSLRASLEVMSRCDCDSSCYGCLRNYGNQFCHEKLKRGPVVDFLSGLIGEKKA